MSSDDAVDEGTGADGATRAGTGDALDRGPTTDPDAGPAVLIGAAALLEKAAAEMDRAGRHGTARSHRAHAQQLRDAAS